MLFGVRTPTAQETYSIINRAINCFKAGAIATGCKYDIRRETLYFDTQQSTELAKCHEEVCRTLHPDDTYIPNQQMTAATDFGDVTYKLPALHPTYFLPDAAKGDQPHSDTFANWTNTPTSMKATMRSASEIAGVAMRSLLDKEWTKTVRSEWQKQMESVDGKNMAIALHKMMDEYEPGDMATMPSCCGHGEEDSL